MFTLNKKLKVNIIAFLLLIMLPILSLFGQPFPLEYDVVLYSVNSGIFDGSEETTELVWDEIIDIGDAPWLRLDFRSANLGINSYVEIISLYDNAKQTLNTISLSEWYYSSAFFNGGKVELKLFIDPNDTGIYLEIYRVLVGNAPENIEGIDEICGTDDNRESSSNPAVGRLLSVNLGGGCTGWIVENGKQLTAGHCVDGGIGVMQFNVPQSLSNGTIQHPSPDDQYSVNQQSIIYKNGGVGNDWAVFEVFNNSNTNLQPMQAQDASFKVVQNNVADQLRVTGYGIDDGVANQTQQTHLGANINSSGNVIKHTSDTKGGNSGSPIIDESTGFAVGIHTHSGCLTLGYNQGTSAYNSNLWNTLYQTVTITLDQKRADNTRLSGTTIGRWNGTSFTNLYITNNPVTISPNTGSTVVLKGYQEIVNNPSEKYRVWERNQTEQIDDIENHRDFQVTPELNNLTSRFYYTYSGVKIKNSLEGTTANGGVIEFRDPWFIDYPDTAFGNQLRNRGMTDALYYSRTSPFYPDYTTSYNGKNYKGVFLNQDYNIPGQPYYSVKANSVQDINLGGSIGTRRFYFLNWGGTGVTFQNANALETPVVFTLDGATAQANLKGTQLSNSLNTYSNNSQRKVVKAYGDILYTTYESMGNIFLEKSTNNGATWQFDYKGPNIYLNNNLAKSSSIDFVDTAFSPILVVFQEATYTDFSKIRLFEKNSKYTPLAPYFVCETYTPNNADVTPIVSVYGYNKFIIIWKDSDIDPVYGEKEGLFYRLGFRTLSNISWLTEKRWIPNTTANSFNPSVAASKTGSGNPVFHLAWQENITSTLSKINYTTLTFNSSNELNMGMVKDISNGSGFKKNYNPTIIELNGGARVGWIGYRDGIYETLSTPNKANSNDEIQTFPNPEWKVVFRDPAVSSFWQFGNNVNSPNINKANNNSAYFLLWTENNGQYNKFTDSYTLSKIMTLNTSGKDIQLSNGLNRDYMRASSFNNNSLPYYFSTSNSIGSYYAQQKTDGLAAISAGREGVVMKGDAEFYFSIGDIKVNDEVIDFIEIEDSVGIDNLDKLNKYLVSKPFTINRNTAFNYGVQYGFTDSASAVNSFADNEYINFKVELVDKNTNEVIGSFDDVRFDKGNVFQYANISYNVNTEGINGNKEVYLRLRVDDDLEGEYSLSQKYADENVLLKSGSKEITYQGNLAVTTYDLAQNYPNPFNPTTTINYQIPKSGFVSLKVYDILGREVAILVNGEKEMGKYTVQFNGSKLASGVYIYELRANEFVSVKKLMLLK